MNRLRAFYAAALAGVASLPQVDPAGELIRAICIGLAVMFALEALGADES